MTIKIRQKKQKNITHNQEKPKNVHAPNKEHKTNNQNQKINKENKFKTNPPAKSSKAKYQASFPESDEEKNNNENNIATDEEIHYRPKLLRCYMINS